MQGTLRFRAGAWRLQVHDGTHPDGRKRFRTSTFRTPNTRAGKAAAERELRRLCDEIDASRPAGGRDLTVTQLCDKWWHARHADWSPSHAGEMRRNIDKRITPHLGDRLAQSITGADLDHLYAELRQHGGRDGNPLAGMTVRKVHAALSAAFGQGVKWGALTANPALAATQPKAELTEIEPPSPEQIAAALASIEARADIAAFFRLAATTGARRGQLCAIQWGDLDLEQGRLTMVRALSIDGTGAAVVKGTKTGARTTVALDPATVAALARWRVEAAQLSLAVGDPLTATSWVFRSWRTNSGPWHPSKPTREWRALADAVGLGTVRLHDLRHAVVTQLLAAGVDVRTVAGRVGHANASMTLGRYGHFMPAKDAEAANTIARIIDGQT